MAQSEQKIKWTQVATMDVMDGRQYENNRLFSKPAMYRHESIGEYIGIDGQFVSVPKKGEYPKIIDNVNSLIHQDLNKGFKEVQCFMSQSLIQRISFSSNTDRTPDRRD